MDKKKKGIYTISYAWSQCFSDLKSGKTPAGLSKNKISFIIHIYALIY